METGGGLEAKAATAAKGECKTWPVLEVATGGLEEDVFDPGLVSGLETGLAVSKVSLGSFEVGSSTVNKCIPMYSRYRLP